MALVYGTLTDFGLDPLQHLDARLYFRASSPGLTGLNLLASAAPVEAVPAYNGYFEVELVSNFLIVPEGTAYAITVEFREARSRRLIREVMPWQLTVPPEGGALGDLLRVPANPALVYTGATPPLDPPTGLWHLDPDTGDLAEYDGNEWVYKAGLRGPAGYNATGAAEDDAAIGRLITEDAGPTEAAAALRRTVGNGRISALHPKYGVPTDGTTDATTALALWLADLGPGNIGVLPPGSYTVSATLNMPAGAAIEGTGATLVAAGAGAGTTLKLANDVRVNGLTLNDPRPYDKAFSRVGISANAATGFTLSNIAVRGYGSVGITLQNCHKFSCTGIQVANIGAKDAGGGEWKGDGLWVGSVSTNFLLSDLDIRDCGRHGLFIWNTSFASATDFAVSNVIAKDNGDCGVILTNAKNFTLGTITAVNNGINGGPYGGQGVQVVGSAGDRTLYGYGTITGVTATDNKENGVELHYVSDMTLSGITGLRNTWSGLALNNSNDTTATAITANDNGTEGISVVGAVGAVLTGITVQRNAWEGLLVRTASTDVIVSAVRAISNGRVSATRAGVGASTGQRISISDVQAYDPATTPTQYYGVRVFGVAGSDVRNVRGSGNVAGLVMIDGTGTADYTYDLPGLSTGNFRGRRDVSGIRDLSGTGTPEGIITASPGSLYRRIDGGTATALYVKEIGTGNTGWKAK